MNYTNPNMTRGFVRRFYPAGAQNVEFDVAAGKRITNVRMLRAGRDLKFDQKGRNVSFEVPSFVDNEVIAIT